MRRTPARISASLVMFLALSAMAWTSTSPTRVAAGPAAAATSAYLPLPSPQRLVDTRKTTMLNPGDVLTLNVTGQAPLLAPGTAVAAAVLNVTAVGPTGIGYWTLYPHGTPLPNASNLNVDGLAAFLGDGLALANMVTVPVGPSGDVDVFSSAGGNVVIDLLGYYVPQVAAVAAGRFVALAAPSRMLDTRTTASPLTATETRTMSVPAAAGASAVVLNVTTIGQAPGYWQVFPTGSAPPATSNLNTMYSGQVASNQVIVPVDASGQFSVYSSGGGDLVVDVIGWFTGTSADQSVAGMFVPLATPTRFLDSRDPSLNPLGGSKRLLPGWDVEVPIATNPAIARPDVAAVVLNLTVNNTLDVGYVSVTPAGSNNPASKARGTSSMNVSWSGQTLAAQVTVPVSARGFDVFAQNPTDIVADVSGYYIGSPVAAAFGPPQNVDPTPPSCETFAYQAIIGSSSGATGLNVSLIQQRLTTLGFWNGGTTGVFSWSTQQAVMAYQKWNGLAPLGFVDGPTAHALNWPNCRATASLTNQGDLMEVDKGRQLGFFVRNGQTLLVLNVSTGGGYFYEADNQITGAKISGTAITDDGTFHIYRVYDQPVYKGTLGTLYRPRFVVGGIAVHGAPNVPGYPASHGCIRVSNPAMDMIWALDLLPMGSKVVVHE